MKGVSNQAKDLIKKILVSASQRPTIEQIMKHPWMTNEPSAIPLQLNIKNFDNFARFSKVRSFLPRLRNWWQISSLPSCNQPRWRP